jgi:hypothetical protein
VTRRASPEHVNQASSKAAVVVLKLAGRFAERGAYRPLEELAQRIQREIVRVGRDALEHENG